MLIDTSKLDVSKTYVVNEFSNSEMGKIIQDLSSKVYKQYHPGIIPTHTFAIFYENEWMVFENHLKHGGIKIYPLSKYESDAFRAYVNEYPLSIESMKYWNNNNPGYSVLNLAEITEKRLIGLPLPDTKGWVCSQSVVACNFKACNDLKLKFEVFTPCDFYFYFNRNDMI